jgi:hypothetical protein
MRSAHATPAAVVHPPGAALVDIAPPPARAPSAVANTPAGPNQWADPTWVGEAAAGAPESWFAAAGLDLNAFNHKSEVNVDPADCLYPEADPRGVNKRDSNCPALRPVAKVSRTLTLPFLAALTWTLVVLAVAVGYYLYRNWRLHLWLRRLRVRGFVLKPASRCGDAVRRASRSEVSKKRASRSRAA